MIAIIDYGMGNLRSVQKGFERVGHAAVITSDPENGPASGMFEFKKGKSTSWRRGIVVTDGAGGTEPISAEYVSRHEPAGTVPARSWPKADIVKHSRLSRSKYYR